MLLKRYQDKFKGGTVSASWTYLRQWAIGAMPANPLVTHDTGPRHLRDPAFLKKALRCTSACDPPLCLALVQHSSQFTIELRNTTLTPPRTVHPRLREEILQVHPRACSCTVQRCLLQCMPLSDAVSHAHRSLFLALLDLRCVCASRYRVARLLHTVAARLQKQTRRLGSFHAWNTCLNHLLALANAHIESVCLDAFYAGVNGCVDPDSRKSLKV